MVAKYEYQAKATRAFGVEFRSKLEAQWAYNFTNDKIEWEYADCEWHDFNLEGLLHVEIKPKATQFAMSAIERAFPFRSKWVDSRMLILCGSPEDHFSVLAAVMKCDKCLKLHLTENKSSIGEFAWSPGPGVYGHWCKHGTFFPNENANSVQC